MSAMNDVKRDLIRAQIKKETSSDLLEKIAARRQEKDAEGSLYFLRRIVKSEEHASMEDVLMADQEGGSHEEARSIH